MNTDSKKFLYKLLETPSPTGFEERIQKVVRSYMKEYADSIKVDYHGNLIVGLNIKAPRRVMLAGHCDQIGFMVKHITEQGYIYVDQLGGIDKGLVAGTKVTIHSESGPIQGVFGRKPIHLQNAEERQRMTLDLTKNWIDIGAKNKKEVEKLIKLGDCITYKLGVTELLNNCISSPGLDNRVGLFVVMEALRLCAKAKLNVALYSVSTVQEEIGLRGARTATHSIDPEIGIGVDVDFANDNPANENPKELNIKLGAGPEIFSGPNSNPIVTKRLTMAAKEGKIPYQIRPDASVLGNDAGAMQISRGGVATGCVSIPNRYMHSNSEVCNLEDLENSAKLLAKFVKDIKPNTDFKPY